VSTTVGVASVQASLVVHPLFHNFQDGFCKCFEQGQRLAYFTRVSSEWITEHGYNMDAPKDTPIFTVCIDAVNKTLFKEWVVFPIAMAVLALICGTQVPKAKVLWTRYTENSLIKKQQHDPGFLIITADDCVKRKDDDPEWRVSQLIVRPVACSQLLALKWEVQRMTSDRMLTGTVKE
jgi:hypothetical protein